MDLKRDEDLAVLHAAFDAARVAHVGIDIQRLYCEPCGVEPARHWFRAIGKAVDRIDDFTAATRARMTPVWVNHTNFMATGPDVDGCGILQGIGKFARGTLKFMFSSHAQRARDQITGHHVAAGDTVIGKPDFDAFYKTGLDKELRARGADTLVLTGFFTDQCVKETALTAKKKGYEVFVAADMTRPAEMEPAECWRMFRQHGVRVVMTPDIVAMCRHG